MKKNISLLIYILLSLQSFAIAQDTLKEHFFNSVFKNDVTDVARRLKSNPGLIDSSFCESSLLSSTCFYPLHYALQHSSSEMINFLLNSNANVNFKQKQSAIMSSSSKSCFELLVMYRNIDEIKRFAFKLKPDAQAYTSALLVAANQKQNEKVLFLLSIGQQILLNP